ncbi:MAG: peptidylprolyl isomerase [Anaerolineales bacterium]|nr:peptidylprolyl isomerase [Anaerolineales bacterium]
MAAKIRKNKFLARAERERRQSQWILIGTIITGVAVLVLVGYALVYEFTLKPNQAVLTVNGEKISADGFRAEFLLRYDGESDPQTVASSVLNTLTNQLLTVQEAEARGFEITDQDVQDTIYSYFGFYPEGTPTPYPSRTPDPDAEPTAAVEVDEEDAGDAAEPTPAPTPTAYTLEMFDENYQLFLDQWASQGIAEEDILESVRRGLYMDRLLNEFRAEIPKAEDQVWARHILVATEAEAQELLDRLDEDESWEDLALEFSLDTSNSANGGDLGWFTRDRMVTEFADAAFALEIGEISGPVETQYGWHLIEVLGHQEQVLDQYSFEYRVQAAYQEFLNTALEEAEVEINQEMVNEVLYSIFPGLAQ